MKLATLNVGKEPQLATRNRPLNRPATLQSRAALWLRITSAPNESGMQCQQNLGQQWTRLTFSTYV